MKKITLFGIVFALLLASQSLWAGSLSIPKGVVKKPAQDLVDSNGDILDISEAARLAAQGVDLSNFDPMANKLWQPEALPLKDTHIRLPRDGQVVDYEAAEASNTFTFLAKVRFQGQYFRLGLSRFTHSVLLRAALLRKLGYVSPIPEFYQNLELRFHSKKQKEDFLLQAQEEMTTDFNSRHWLKSETENSVVLALALLEPMSNEVFDIDWGYAPSAKNSAQASLLRTLSVHRAFRALILPYVLVDIPESINRFSLQVGSQFAGQVVFAHPYAESFAACGYDDAKWLARKINAFTEQDWQEIVDRGHLPPSLQELVKAKLMYRARGLSELFELPSNLKVPTLKINNNDVKNGKVVSEYIDQMPLRYSHGDRPSPFTDGDLQRYLKIDAYTSVVSNVLTKLNEKLQLLDTEVWAQKYQDGLKQKVVDHIRSHPDQPFYQPVESWGGMIAGLDVGASRHITTGAYYESTATMQLVDNLSVGASIGYFRGLAGVENLMPSALVKGSVIRDFTHVRPVASLKEANKVSWANLIVPRFMKNLSGVLEQSEITLEDGRKQFTVDKFLSELKTGEVFIVTDSLAIGGQAQLSSPLSAILGFTPFDYLNSVALGVDATRVALRQTVVMRTSEGLQVFVRRINNKAWGLQGDINYFLNLVRLRSQTQYTNGYTDAFVLDYSTELSEWLNEGEKGQEKLNELREKMRPALSALFKNNDSEILFANFKDKKLAIEHGLKSKELSLKLLWTRHSNFEEVHDLKVRFPMVQDLPDLRPQDEEVHLVTARKGELSGVDLLGFTFDILNGWLGPKKVKFDVLQSANPANMPFGRSFFRMVTTESDLTQGATSPMPDVGILQYVWGGWSLKQNKFIKLLTEINARFKVRGQSLAPIPVEQFYSVKSLDFYRITAQISILPGAIEKVKELLLQKSYQPIESGKKGQVSKIFSKLSEVLGQKKDLRDKKFFEETILVLGQGDRQKGLSLFQEMCSEDKVREQHTQTGAWLNGSYYDCLTPWMTKLLGLRREFPKDRKSQTLWTARVLFILSEKIPFDSLVEFLGEPNYLFFVRINGFRAGDEDGDLEYFSNTYGDPTDHIDYANGLVSYLAKKIRVAPSELDRTNGGYR